MHQHLLNVISQSVSLTQTDIDLCKACFEPVLFPKNRVIEGAMQYLVDYQLVELK